MSDDLKKRIGRPKGSTSKLTGADIEREFKAQGINYLQVLVSDFMASGADAKTRLAYHSILAKYLISEVEPVESTTSRQNLSYEELVSATRAALAVAEATTKG